MKKLRLLILCRLLALILSACWTDKKNESWTGEIATGTLISWAILPVNQNQNFFSWGGETWTLTEERTLSWSENLVQDWFPIKLCNQIVALNLCVISKAPLENQPVMKAQLQKSLEPRKLLADADLRQICQNIVEQTSFQEVMKHYTGTGNACSF